MHYRQQLREAVRDALGAVPVFEGRCHINRARKLGRGELPAVCIYTRRSVTDRHVDQWTDKKTCTLEIELHVGGTDAEVLAADIDTLCLVIESELLKDQTLGGICEDIESRQDEIETDADGEYVTVHCRMTYEATFVFQNVVTADDFKLVGVEWDLAPKDGRIAALDEIELPQ